MVIEIDTPGHTAAIARTHPDYVACFEAEPWWDYAVQPPAGQLRFANETVQAFAAELFGNLAEVVKGSYVGTGGDELNRKCMVCIIISLFQPIRCSLLSVCPTHRARSSIQLLAQFSRGWS